MKVLIIQFYQTGDVVLTTHIPREIKKLHPDAEIDFLTFKANAPLLRHNPHLRQVISIDRKDSFLTFLKSLLNIRSREYDVVLDFQNNPRSMYFAIASGALKKVTYEGSRRQKLYNTPVKRLTGTAVEIKMSLMQAFVDDISNLGLQTELYFSEEAHSKAVNFYKSCGITDGDFVVTISPTHKRAVRRWAFRHFYRTAEHLIDNHGAKVVFTYGPGEKKYLDDGFARCGGIKQNMYTAGDIPLDEFTAVLSRANLHIGNDSAPHHIATARRVPTFIIIGSTSEGWVFPSKEHTWVSAGLECQPCKKSECRFDRIRCMEDFGFEDIQDSLERFINDVVTG